MKIKTSKVTKILLTELDHLDPVNIFLEDYGPAQGKITISCYDESWTYYWGSMGEGNTLASFFCSCNNDYLSGKLSPQCDRNIPEDDEDKCREHAKKYVITDMKDGNISEEKALELLEVIRHTTFPATYDEYFEIYGQDFGGYLPTMSNYKYEYLGRVIDAVREGLKLYMEKV